MNRDDEELEILAGKIEAWPPTDFPGLMEFIRKHWHLADWGWSEEDATEGRCYRVSTAGWSDNEFLIDALQKNWMYWAMCWRSSRRGGHYEFVLRVPEKKCIECGHAHRRGPYFGSCQHCTCSLVCVCPQDCAAHPPEAPPEEQPAPICGDRWEQLECSRPAGHDGEHGTGSARWKVAKADVWTLAIEALEHCRNRPHEHNPDSNFTITECEVIDSALAALRGVSR